MQRTSQVILPEPTMEPADEYLSQIGRHLEKYPNETEKLITYYETVPVECNISSYVYKKCTHC
jgi:hypothetical protein